jgi:hypothetical protein
MKTAKTSNTIKKLPGAHGNQMVRVVQAVHEGATSVREVGKACGWASPNTTHRWCVMAQEAGLIAWNPEHYGSMRPALKVVRVCPPAPH